MIHLYSWGTPNGKKITISLEEMGLAYQFHPIDIMKGDQFTPDFLKISPNNKIPAIVDDETGLSVFESGAILIYLAEKSGKFLPAIEPGRYQVMEWLMWQMGGFGPMTGQLGYFNVFAPEKVPPAIERFTKEVTRLLGVLDKRLAEVDYVAGDYSIADMAIYPWLENLAGFYKLPDMIEPFAHIKAYMKRNAERPATQKGMIWPRA